MPRLLKSGEVQLHMPRTGGRSLAKQIGVKKLVGTMHDGIDQIPEAWKGKPVVATFRDPKGWFRSMSMYLIGLKDHRKHWEVFQKCSPPDLRSYDFDPTFGLWADPKGYFKMFIYENTFNSWYEAYCDYFLSPADRIIPIHTLTVHKVEP